jgi:hypothetical protein
MDANEKAKNTQTVLQSVTPTFMPTDGEVMTLRIDYPPGDPGIPPHRHIGRPCFGYVLEAAPAPVGEVTAVVPRTAVIQHH